MERIIVTGGYGLVGSAVRRMSVNYANYEFIYISSSEYDLTIMDDTRRMFVRHMPRYVIHLASCVGGLYKNMNNKVKMLEENLLMNFNVVKCCHDFKVAKLVACLSTCIFPDNTTYPINETMLHNGPPHSSNDTYAYAKRMLHIQCKAYRESYGDNFVCVIPTNVYGPNDNFNLMDGHVIPSLIHRCFIAKQLGEHFIVKGTGSPLRQFVYADDLADLIVWSLINYNEETLILSVPEKDEICIGHVARLIAQRFDYNDYILFDESHSDGQYKKTADNSILMDKIGQYDFTGIELGIATTVDWFIENHSVARK
jgi:GDP-L-fucose synthase